MMFRSGGRNAMLPTIEFYPASTEVRTLDEIQKQSMLVLVISKAIYVLPQICVLLRPFVRFFFFFGPVES